MTSQLDYPTSEHRRDRATAGPDITTCPAAGHQTGPRPAVLVLPGDAYRFPASLQTWLPSSVAAALGDRAAARARHHLLFGELIEVAANGGRRTLQHRPDEQLLFVYAL